MLLLPKGSWALREGLRIYRRAFAVEGRQQLLFPYILSVAVGGKLEIEGNIVVVDPSGKCKPIANCEQPFPQVIDVRGEAEVRNAKVLIPASE